MEESDSEYSESEEEEPQLLGIKELKLIPMPAEREMNGPSLAEEEDIGSVSISDAAISEIRRDQSQQNIEEIEAQARDLGIKPSELITEEEPISQQIVEEEPRV